MPEPVAGDAKIARVVAIDLSTWWASVALLERAGTARGAAVVAETEERVEGSHAPHVLGWIERLLVDAGWSRSSVDGFVATRGPGSFTGVRIALGTIRGLSIASGRPCAAVPTLLAMAHAHGAAPRDRIAVLTASRRDIFAARHDPASSPPRPVGDPWFGPVSSLEVADGDPAILIPALGQENAARALAAATGHQCAAAVRGVAAAAGRLALAADFFAEGSDLAPLYLRPPVATRDTDAS